MNTKEFSGQLLEMEQSLLKYAYHLKLDNSDSSDLIQETFLKAILSRNKFVNTGFLSAWIFTIMRNSFINNYRRNCCRIPIPIIPFKMYVEGYRYREIADTFNLTIGTVKSRIFLARMILMNQLIV